MTQPSVHHRPLVPPDNRVLLGIGQSPEAFAAFVATFPHHLPAMYMAYCGLRRCRLEHFAGFKQELDAYAPQMILQLGLSMTKDGSPERHYEHAVAAGEHDEDIAVLVQGLALLKRPMLLRIGYEFNGDWNGYQPASFVAAWQRVAQAIRAAQLPHPVALVWTYAPEGSDKDWHAYYPGDEWVDWWGIDLFSEEHFSAADSNAFAQEAADRGFPLMIGESTPRYVGVHAADAWQRWFQPYLDYIQRHNVRAISYINWEWSSFPQWHDWGDGRLEAAPEGIRNAWQAFIEQSEIVCCSDL